jgi:mono/diheme cytochrome c family protein
MKIFCILNVLSIVLFIASCSDANKGANLTVTNTTAINTANTNTMAASTPAKSPAADVAGGEALYKKNCAACHKENGTGGKVTIDGKTLKPDNLVNDRKKAAPDDKFHAWIANGVPDEGMPAFKEKLNDQQIAEIVQYIRTGLQKQSTQ